MVIKMSPGVATCLLEEIITLKKFSIDMWDTYEIKIFLVVHKKETDEINISSISYLI